MSHDEVFSADVARMPWGAMMRAVIADVVHPPLFYVLLKLWILVGGASVFWMRLLPCILSLFMVIPLQGLCNELVLSRGAIAVVLVLATFNPFLIRYSQEVRMYSLLALLSVTSLWLFTRFLNREKDATVLGFLLAINLLLIYTHYYGFLWIGSQFVVACAWTIYHSCDARPHKVRRYLLSLPMLGLAFSPWALVVIRAALRKGGLQDNLAWILVPTIKDVAWFYQTLNGAIPLRHTTILGLILFMFPVAMALRTSRRSEIAALSVFTFLPTALAFVASHILPLSVFDPRFLIGCALPYLLMVVISICSMTSFKRSMSVIVVLWSVWAGINYVRFPVQKIAWDVLATKICNHARVYTTEDYEHLPLAYYGIENALLPRQVDPFKLGETDFFFVYREDTCHGKRPQAAWSTQGCEIVDSISEHAVNETITAVHVRMLKASSPQTYTSCSLTAPCR